jgi:L-threonylcarbamoyladenylate synthase
MLNESLQQAITILHQGGLVAMPTETVYGLAADAKNPEALTKIFQAKGRPADHPLIVHIGDISQLDQWAIDISPATFELAKQFWPGPLTLILKKASHVSGLITGGQNTIGLRIPNHPIALSLLKLFGSGVAAPSANRFGRISPTTADAVREELSDAVDLILDGGQCEVGVESTILDMSGDSPRILRPGMISAEQIEKVLHQHLSQQKNNSPRVSGSLESHYAPRTKVVLLNKHEFPSFLQNSAVMCFSSYEGFNIITMPSNPIDYAHDLYKVLRELDKKNLQQIIIEKVPESSEWDAIRDRLQRASHD